MYLAELSLAGLVLPSPSLGLPAMPPPVPVDFRGVAIHWLAYDLPTSGPSLQVAPTVPVPTWNWAGIRFSSLSTDRVDRQPLTIVERDAYVRLAAAMVVARNDLSQQSTLLWEIRLPSLTTVAFRVRARQSYAGRPAMSESVGFRVQTWGTNLLVTRGAVELHARVGSPDLVLRRGTAAFRARTHPLGITAPPTRVGDIWPSVGSRAAVFTDYTDPANNRARSTSVVLRGYTWATWGTPPIPPGLGISKVGLAAFRSYAHPLGIAAPPTRVSAIAPRVDARQATLWEVGKQGAVAPRWDTRQGSTGKPDRNGTAAFRVRSR